MSQERTDIGEETDESSVREKEKKQLQNVDSNKHTLKAGKNDRKKSFSCNYCDKEYDTSYK